MYLADTIVAPIPPGSGAVAIVRLSVRARSKLRRWRYGVRFVRKRVRPRRAPCALCEIRDPESGAPLDRALLALFPAK